ncbi:hypothetical protein POPTR_010G134950v4 [Populus trichocarpa]|uniref:Uncharacterized protein n=1 Tax=Populus trichocarpa TaxID=3694 RepID=A0ACC0SDC7_POPTR|nr:hypothetical protein BDE02_10G120800 [Populus trichocarpa]KAI9387180.1 hypothetical protein POPTR_010G134950v4 [Populus trichocarpa]
MEMLTCTEGRDIITVDEEETWCTYRYQENVSQEDKSYRSRQKLVKTGRKKMVLLTGLSIMDLVVAGISLVIGLGIFVFIASILCSAAFLHNAKHVS